jgi:plastocyanin
MGVSVMSRTAQKRPLVGQADIRPEGTPMPRKLPLVLASALAVAAITPAAASAATTLNGTVGPGFTIGLKGPRGATVTQLKPGTYRIVVRDLSNIHDFHLTGPGVNKTTSVSGKGTATWTVKVSKGTYKYVCDPHASMMHGSFSAR